MEEPKPKFTVFTLRYERSGRIINLPEYLKIQEDYRLSEKLNAGYMADGDFYWVDILAQKFEKI